MGTPTAGDIGRSGSRQNSRYNISAMAFPVAPSVPNSGCHTINTLKKGLYTDCEVCITGASPLWNVCSCDAPHVWSRYVRSAVTEGVGVSGLPVIIAPQGFASALLRVHCSSEV